MIETDDEDHAIDDQGHVTAIEVEIEDHDREIDQSLAIETAPNQEIDQPIRIEIDLDLGIDDRNRATDHDPALDREQEHTQEIKTIMLEMQRFVRIFFQEFEFEIFFSRNHDQNQLIKIAAQKEDHAKNGKFDFSDFFLLNFLK